MCVPSIISKSSLLPLYYFTYFFFHLLILHAFSNFAGIHYIPWMPLQIKSCYFHDLFLFTKYNIFTYLFAEKRRGLFSLNELSTSRKILLQQGTPLYIQLTARPHPLLREVAGSIDNFRNLFVQFNEQIRFSLEDRRIGMSGLLHQIHGCIFFLENDSVKKKKKKKSSLIVCISKWW